MQFKSALLAAAMLGQALSCVQFQATADEFYYLVGTLVDNGGTVCTANTYGDNNGWGFNCWSGYSAYLNFGNGVVSYGTPHGSYTFGTDDVEDCFEDEDTGCEDVYTASVFGC